MDALGHNHFNPLMKKRIYLLACVICLIIPAYAADEHEESALAKQMEVLNDAFKAFRKETDPEKAAAQVREAHQAVLKSIGESPEMLVKMPEGREKMVALAEYHKMMGQLLVTLSELELSFLSGKKEETTRLLEAMKDLKKKGHNQFMEE